jgi:hypothetical protein
MFCVSCGKAYEPHHKFCKHCGQPLTETSEKPPDQVDTTQPDTVPSPPLDLVEASTGPTDLNSPRVQTFEERQLKGLRGWLILVGFGLVAGVFYWTYALYGDVKLFNDGTIQFLSDPSSSIHMSGYSGLLRFEAIGQLAIVGISVCLINLFFRKSWRFPRYYIVFLLATVLFTALDYGLAASAFATAPEATRKTLDETLSGQGTKIGQSLLAALVWSLYMVKSKRVKVTFVN